jgi:membrane-associated protein
MGGMHWRNFVVYNVLGGITWSSLFILLGYFFGGIPFVQEHFELLIVVIVVLSAIPTVVGLIRSQLNKRKADETDLPATQEIPATQETTVTQDSSDSQDAPQA